MGFVIVSILAAACAAAPTFVLLVQGGVPLVGVFTGTGLDLPLPMSRAFIALLVGVVGAGILSTLMPQVTVRAANGPTLIGPDSIAHRAGITVGAVVATEWHATNIGKLIIFGIAAVAALMALSAFRAFVAEVRTAAREFDQRQQLHADGMRVIALVTQVMLRGWAGNPVFWVEAHYEASDGTHTVTGELTTPVSDAPVVDGTVIVVIDPANPREHLLEADPDSVRDPEADTKYVAPDA